MTELEQQAGPRRSWRWYGKFFFAFYAAGFASWMIILVVALFIAGQSFVEAWVIRFSGLVMLGFGLAWSPVIWRHLR